uniref:Uncharacterized protein n=1 Tax=Candidatus Kentrum sp. MB TaxID=2138164 RepID=A0A450XPP2_9GAMM|nr:MAG: hypothetical protein BECKMB1821G_GA0114241_102428 [Candidatus Kentron sp. MB]VFK31214.1 MAG: hypothetical protein BECKMB1821I_GA0114274_102127 [Candidatus Kentron sp. MB]VFK75394.1 MAG: hypothetical protein BECKMB1821H_GA0114242_102128 [Candidatus Kentron sp. MB]
MHSALQVDVSPDRIIAAVKAMDGEARQEFIEDLLAATSPEYLESIRQARNDYREGHVYSHEDVFSDQ